MKSNNSSKKFTPELAAEVDRVLSVLSDQWTFLGETDQIGELTFEALKVLRDRGYLKLKKTVQIDLHARQPYRFAFEETGAKSDDACMMDFIVANSPYGWFKKMKGGYIPVIEGFVRSGIQFTGFAKLTFKTLSTKKCGYKVVEKELPIETELQILSIDEYDESDLFMADADRDGIVENSAVPMTGAETVSSQTTVDTEALETCEEAIRLGLFLERICQLLDATNGCELNSVTADAIKGAINDLYPSMHRLGHLLCVQGKEEILSKSVS